MKIKSALGLGVGLALAAAVITTNQSYKRWRQEQVLRLQSGSYLLETPSGMLEYQIEGHGPVVMVIHGSPGGYDQGLAVAHSLDLGDFTVLSLSRPGYRRTPLTSGETPEQQADLFVAALDALHISHVILIAVSGGGPSALQFALRHPERCQKLVLLDALSQDYTEERVYHSLPMSASLSKRLLDRLTSFDPFLYVILLLLRLAPNMTRLREFVSSLVTNNLHTAGYRNDMQQFATLPVYPVHDIALPILVIHGTDDVDIPFVQAERLAKKLPQATLVPIEGADHLAAIASERAKVTTSAFVHDSL